MSASQRSDLQGLFLQEGKCPVTKDVPFSLMNACLDYNKEKTEKSLVWMLKQQLCYVPQFVHSGAGVIGDAEKIKAKQNDPKYGQVQSYIEQGTWNPWLKSSLKKVNTTLIDANYNGAEIAINEFMVSKKKSDAVVTAAKVVTPVAAGVGIYWFLRK